MAQLKLFLLGTPIIQIDEQEIFGFNTRKDRALLAYLAVTGRSHIREHLAGLLWSDLPESKALRNLRHTLSHLRKVIGPAWIKAEHSVSLTQNLQWQVDVQILRSVIGDFTKLSTDQISQQRVDALYAILNLYRGEFLQGFYLQKAGLFEEWVVSLREELHLLALQGLELVAQYDLTHGRYEQGLAATRRLLQLDSWSEIGHRLLMKLLALSGQRAAALAHYEQCRQLLADELGIEPMAETKALYLLIQLGTFSHVHLPEEPVVSVATSPTNATTSNSLAIPHNLLTPLATFIGRTNELAFINERLAAADCRLLTITGPGGIGKSSLALAAGRRLLDSPDTPFPDGIFFVALADIEVAMESRADNANLGMSIVTSIAESIGCQFQENQPVQLQLQAYLQPRRLLLILDNFEQFVAHTDLIVTLLSQAPHVTMLLTSRLRLNVQGETTLPLKGLSLPSADLSQSRSFASSTPLAPNASPHLNRSSNGGGASFYQDFAWQTSEAVALFVERAQCLEPSFTMNAATIGPVVEICQAVEGLPLALEMIAAWVNLYTWTEIVEKLTEQKHDDELLISHFSDQPKRHRTLQKVFDDSWTLLHTEGQWALARLSIFNHHFTRKAALTIAEITLSDLFHLRNHSLLQIDADNNYSLHPLIKQFAMQKWQLLTQHQPQQHSLLQQAHSHYYLHEVATLTTVRGEAVLAAIRVYQKDHTEIVRAWHWAAQQQDRTLLQQSMTGLFRYLELTNQTKEGKELFNKISVEVNDPTIIWMQVAQCHFMRRLAEYDQAHKRLQELLPILLAARDQQNTSSHQVVDAPGFTSGFTLLHTHTFALLVLGWAHYEQGDYDAAHHCFATAYSQAETVADPPQAIEMRNGLGAVAFSTKEYAIAYQHYQAALTLARQQADLHYIAIILGNLAALAQATNAYGEAERYLQMRLQIDQQTQNARQMAVSYQRLGQLALARDAYATAETHFRKSLTYFEQLGHSPEVAHVLLDLSKSLLRQNQLYQAEVDCLRSLQWSIQAQMTPRVVAALTLLAEIQIEQGQKEKAAILLQMVKQSPQISAVTWKTVQKLHALLTAELGEDMIMRISQESMEMALQTFGLQLLIDKPLKGHARLLV